MFIQDAPPPIVRQMDCSYQIGMAQRLDAPCQVIIVKDPRTQMSAISFFTPSSVGDLDVRFFGATLANGLTIRMFADGSKQPNPIPVPGLCDFVGQKIFCSMQISDGRAINVRAE